MTQTNTSSSKVRTIRQVVSSPLPPPPPTPPSLVRVITDDTPSDPDPKGMPGYFEKTAALSALSGFAVHRITAEGSEWASLSKCLDTPHPEWLNIGADVKEKETSGSYNKLELAAAWRIENPTVWESYRARQSTISRDCRRANESSIPLPGDLGVLTIEATRNLPGFNGLKKSLQERYLLHGTTPDVLVDVIANGFNEHYSTSGAFGNGLYFAEDAGERWAIVALTAFSGS